MYRKRTNEMTRMALFFALLIVTAKLVISLPLLDYLSLQIITVFLIYPFLGKKDGSIIMISYLVLGVIGLPIFASGGGFAYVFKPTFGFLLAFATLPLIQALLTQLVRQQKWSPLTRMLIINYSSLFYIHLIGIGYKLVILRLATQNFAALSSILTVTTLIDLSCDILLVFVASVVTLKMKSLLGVKASGLFN